MDVNGSCPSPLIAKLTRITALQFQCKNTRIAIPAPKVNSLAPPPVDPPKLIVGVPDDEPGLPVGLEEDEGPLLPPRAANAAPATPAAPATAMMAMSFPIDFLATMFVWRTMVAAASP